MSSISPNAIRDRFAEIVSLDDPQVDLAKAALLIAAEEYPRLDVDLYLERLDRLGERANERAAGARDAIGAIDSLNKTLFDEMGFRGNSENYYDPRNSYLNEVIDRRTGIPITLTVVYMEVARRVGLSVKGVGLPYHFIARLDAANGVLFIDPFNEGHLMTSVECDELVTRISGGKSALRPEHLEPVTNKQILTRMLSNLVGVHSASDHRRALASIERILLINPESATHIRDRGLLLAQLGDHSAAIAELERYIEMTLEAPDADSIREQIKTLFQTQARLN